MELNGGPCGWISDSRQDRSGRWYEAISGGFIIFMQGAMERLKAEERALC